MSCTSLGVVRRRSERSRYQSISARSASRSSRRASASRRWRSGGISSRSELKNATSVSTSPLRCWSDPAACQPAGGGLDAEAAASAIMRSAASEARSRRSSNRRSASSAALGGGSCCSTERHLEFSLLEPGARRGVSRHGGRKHDRTALAVHPYDQLEPDLLQRDLALAGEGQRHPQAGAVVGDRQLLRDRSMKDCGGIVFG